MKKLYITLLTAILYSHSSPAQYVEGGLFLGISNYLGDLSPVGFTPRESHPAIGGIVRINPKQWISVRANFLYGTISGNDQNQRSGLRERGFRFNSPLYELSCIAEITLARIRLLNNRLTPFVMVGIGVFHFNPHGPYGDNQNDVALQPLGTEGQGVDGSEKYKLTQLPVPLGIGLKYLLTPHWRLGMECGFRKTFTDYLDDVSLRGDPKNMDWYMFAGITITYIFIGNGEQKGETNGRKSRKTKCFKFPKEQVIIVAPPK